MEQQIAKSPSLNEDKVKARELFSFAAERLDTEWILLCHPTGPLILPSSLRKAINACLVEGYDSACSVQRIQNYCWLNGSPLNYQLDSIPQTQDLEPVFIETSGFYLFKKSSFLSSGKRLNGKVSLIEVDEKESVDIDEAKDFELALNHLKPRSFKRIIDICPY